MEIKEQIRVCFADVAAVAIILRLDGCSIHVDILKSPWNEEDDIPPLNLEPTRPRVLSQTVLPYRFIFDHIYWAFLSDAREMTNIGGPLMGYSS